MYLPTPSVNSPESVLSVAGLKGEQDRSLQNRMAVAVGKSEIDYFDVGSVVGDIYFFRFKALGE